LWPEMRARNPARVTLQSRSSSIRFRRLVTLAQPAIPLVERVRDIISEHTANVVSPLRSDRDATAGSEAGPFKEAGTRKALLFAGLVSVLWVQANGSRVPIHTRHIPQPIHLSWSGKKRVKRSLIPMLRSITGRSGWTMLPGCSRREVSVAG
jgi:hypothetical protein